MAKSKVPRWEPPRRRLDEPEPEPDPSLPCECHTCRPTCRRRALPDTARRRVHSGRLCSACDRGSHWIDGAIHESPSRARRRLNRAHRMDGKTT